MSIEVKFIKDHQVVLSPTGGREEVKISFHGNETTRFNSNVSITFSDYDFTSHPLYQGKSVKQIRLFAKPRHIRHTQEINFANQSELDEFSVATMTPYGSENNFNGRVLTSQRVDLSMFYINPLGEENHWGSAFGHYYLHVTVQVTYTDNTTAVFLQFPMNNSYGFYADGDTQDIGQFISPFSAIQYHLPKKYPTSSAELSAITTSKPFKSMVLLRGSECVVRWKDNVKDQYFSAAYSTNMWVKLRYTKSDGTLVKEFSRSINPYLISNILEADLDESVTSINSSNVRNKTDIDKEDLWDGKNVFVFPVWLYPNDMVIDDGNLYVAIEVGVRSPSNTFEVRRGGYPDDNLLTDLKTHIAPVKVRDLPVIADRKQSATHAIGTLFKDAEFVISPYARPITTVSNNPIATRFADMGLQFNVDTEDTYVSYFKSLKPVIGYDQSKMADANKLLSYSINGTRPRQPSRIENDTDDFVRLNVHSEYPDELGLKKQSFESLQSRDNAFIGSNIGLFDSYFSIMWIVEMRLYRHPQDVLNSELIDSSNSFVLINGVPSHNPILFFELQNFSEWYRSNNFKFVYDGDLDDSKPFKVIYNHRLKKILPNLTTHTWGYQNKPEFIENAVDYDPSELEGKSGNFNDGKLLNRSKILDGDPNDAGKFYLRVNQHYFSNWPWDYRQKPINVATEVFYEKVNGEPLDLRSPTGFLSDDFHSGNKAYTSAALGNEKTRYSFNFSIPGTETLNRNVNGIYLYQDDDDTDTNPGEPLAYIPVNSKEEGLSGQLITRSTLNRPINIEYDDDGSTHKFYYRELVDDFYLSGQAGSKPLLAVVMQPGSTANDFIDLSSEVNYPEITNSANITITFIPSPDNVFVATDYELWVKKGNADWASTNKAWTTEGSGDSASKVFYPYNFELLPSFDANPGKYEGLKFRVLGKNKDGYLSEIDGASVKTLSIDLARTNEFWSQTYEIGNLSDTFNKRTLKVKYENFPSNRRKDIETIQVINVLPNGQAEIIKSKQVTLDELLSSDGHEFELDVTDPAKVYNLVNRVVYTDNSQSQLNSDRVAPYVYTDSVSRPRDQGTKVTSINFDPDGSTVTDFNLKIIFDHKESAHREDIDDFELFILDKDTLDYVTTSKFIAKNAPTLKEAIDFKVTDKSIPHTFKVKIHYTDGFSSDLTNSVSKKFLFGILDDTVTTNVVGVTQTGTEQSAIFEFTEALTNDRAGGKFIKIYKSTSGDAGTFVYMDHSPYDAAKNHQSYTKLLTATELGFDHLYFKSTIEYNDDEESDLALAPVFDFAVPKTRAEGCTIVSIVPGKAVFRSASLYTRPIVVTFLPNTTNNRTDITSYNLYEIDISATSDQWNTLAVLKATTGSPSDRTLTTSLDVYPSSVIENTAYVVGVTYANGHRSLLQFSGRQNILPKVAGFNDKSYILSAVPLKEITSTGGKHGNRLTVNFDLLAANERTDIKEFHFYAKYGSLDYHDVPSFVVSDPAARTFTYDVYQDDSINHYFKILTKYNDNTETSLADMAEFTYQFSNFGNNDFASFTGQVNVSGHGVDGPRSTTQLIVNIVAYANNVRKDVKNFILYRKGEGDLTYIKVSDVSIADASDYGFSVFDDDGPTHTFKALIVFDDDTVTALEKAQSISWTDVDYGATDGTLIKSIQPGGRSDELSTPLVITFEMSAFSERSSFDHYQAKISTKFGTPREASTYNRVEDLSFTYNAVDIEGPEYSFKVIPVYLDSDGDEQRIEEDKCIAKEWVNPVYGKKDGVVIGTITKTGDTTIDGFAADVIDIPFTLKSENDRNEDITGFQLFKQNTYDTGIKLQNEIEASERRFSFIFNRHEEGKTGTFYVKIKWGDEVSLTTAEATRNKVYTASDYGSKDLFTLSPATKGIITVEGGRRKFKISGDVVRGVKNDRTDILRYSLYATKASEDNYALIGTSEASDGVGISGYLFADQGPTFNLKIQVTWNDAQTTSLIDATSTEFIDVDYGTVDFCTVLAIDSSGGVVNEKQLLTATYVASSTNDQKNPVKYMLYLSKELEPDELLADTIDSNQPFSFKLPIDATKDVSFYALLKFANGNITSEAYAPRKAWTLGSYGDNDKVNIVNVLKKTYFSTVPEYYELFITAKADVNNNRPFDSVVRYKLYARKSTDSLYEFTHITYVPVQGTNHAEFTYKAYNSDNPDWSFKVLAEFSDGETDISVATPHTLRIIDPGNTDHAIAVAPIAGLRELTQNGWGTRIRIPFRISTENYRKSIVKYNLYVKFNDGNYGLPIGSLDHASSSELEFSYLAMDADKPKWTFWVELEFSEGPNSTPDKSVSSEWFKADPEQDDVLQVRDAVMGPLSRDGSGHLQNTLSVFFQKATGFDRLDIEQYQLYASTVGHELTDMTDISATALNTADHFAYNAVRRDGPTWYFRAKAKFSNGDLTKSTDYLAWSMDNWSDGDKVIASEPVEGGHVLNENGDYTPLNLAFSLDADNDRKESLVLGYKLYVSHKNNQNVFTNVGYVNKDENHFVYDAKDVNGPEFSFKIVIVFEKGQNSDLSLAREIDWVFADYASDDAGEVTGVVVQERALDADGNDGTYVGISFRQRANNDRDDVQRYLINESHDGGTIYNVIDTPTTNTSPVRYFAKDINGPEWKFKVQLEYTDGKKTKLESSVPWIWPLESYGDLDNVIIDNVTKGPLIEDAQGNWKNDLNINYHLPKINDRLDQIGYVLQASRPGQTKWTEVATNNKNVFTFLFTAPVSDGPYWNFRIILKYANNEFSNEIYATPYHFQNADPDDTDRANITDVEVEGTFTVNSETGSNLKITYSPEKTNRRNKVELYKLYRELTSDGNGYVLDETLTKFEPFEVKVYDKWKELINFKVVLEFEDGSSTNIDKTVHFVFDNRDPLNEDNIFIVDADVQRRTVYKTKAATEIYITFAADADNNRSDLVSYTLKVKKNETGDYNKVSTLYVAGQGFTYYAVDDEGPIWDFIVIGEFSNGKETSEDNTPSKRYFNPDPLDTDQIKVKNIGTLGNTLVQGKQAVSLIVTYLANTTNLRKNVKTYTLAVSKNGATGDYVDITTISDSSPFYYSAIETEGPKWWFKVFAIFDDGSRTNKENAEPLQYVLDDYGKSDYAKITDVTPGMSLNDGKATEIIVSFIPGTDNDRLSVTNYMLMVKSSLQSSFADAMTLTDSNAPFKYVANHDQGPSWEFWVKINYTDGSFTTYNSEHDGSYVDKSLDKGVVTHVFKGERFTVTGRSGNELIIQFKEGENNAR